MTPQKHRKAICKPLGITQGREGATRLRFQTTSKNRGSHPFRLSTKRRYDCTRILMTWCRVQVTRAREPEAPLLIRSTVRRPYFATLDPLREILVEVTGEFSIPSSAQLRWCRHRHSRTSWVRNISSPVATSVVPTCICCDIRSFRFLGNPSIAVPLSVGMPPDSGAR